MQHDPGDRAQQNGLDLKYLRARRRLDNDDRRIGRLYGPMNPESGNSGDIDQRGSVASDLHKGTRPDRFGQRIRRFAKAKLDLRRFIGSECGPCGKRIQSEGRAQAQTEEGVIRQMACLCHSGFPASSGPRV